MTDKPREILCELIKTYGEETIDNPIRFQNLIEDYFLGEFKKEQKCLTDSIEEGIPSGLLEKTQQLPYNLLSSQLTQRLINLGFTSDIAQWTVDSWALAFGVITDEQLINIQKPAKKPRKINTVDINSNPPGATVYLDGIEQPGQTPLKVPVASGKHKIILKLAGFHDGEETITLKKDTPVNFNLIELAGLGYSIKITTSPPDADVYLDGIFQGATPLTISNVIEGPLGVRCSLTGYEDIVTQISINKDTPLNYILTKEVASFGSVSISSDPTGAELYLDGKLEGRTPLDIPTVSFGSHDLLFALSGYTPAKQIIFIPRCTNTSVKLSKQTHSGENPQTQEYKQNFPNTLSQNPSGKNKGLVNLGVICLALIIVGGLIFGLISYNSISSTNPAAVSTGIGAIVTPIIPIAPTQDPIIGTWHWTDYYMTNTFFYTFTSNGQYSTSSSMKEGTSSGTWIKWGENQYNVTVDGRIKLLFVYDPKTNTIATTDIPDRPLYPVGKGSAIVTPAPVQTTPKPTPTTTYQAPSKSSGTSTGKCYVNGYYRKSGTYVKGYYRSC